MFRRPITERSLLPRKILLVFITLFVSDAYGHVALTFPRARKYDLDFLDSARTPGPCGMPRGDIKTSLLSGSQFNVTWHLAYPHRGGFRLQILDALDRPLVDLTPVTKQSEFVEEDATAQHYPVELPQNFTCTDCTIRLLREAEEWGTSYRFWSCADIDILDRKTYREDCSGHGRSLVGRCRCDRFYHGPRCEFREDCLDDSDCGNQGICVDNGGTTFPTKHCYCNVGWFGPGCAKRSSIKSTEIDLQGHTMIRFSDDFVFYWRILKDSKELEGVMVVNGTSWVGVGWRPSSLTPSCRAFPEIHGKNHVTPETLPQPEPKSQTQAKNNNNNNNNNNNLREPKPEPTHGALTGEPTAEPSSRSAKRRSPKSPRSELGVTATSIDNDVTVQTSVTYQVSTKQGRKKRSPESTTGTTTREPEPTSQPEPKLKPKISEPQPEPEPESEPKPEPEPEPRAESEPEPKPEPEPEPEPKAEPEPEPKPEPKSISKIENVPQPKAEPEPRLKSISKFESVPQPKPEPEPKAEPEPEPRPEPEPEPEPKAEPEPEPKPKSNIKHSSEPHPEPEPEPHPEPEPEPHPEPEPEPNSKSSFESENEDSEVSTKSGATKAPVRPEVHEYTPKHDFNPMDCTDMIIGMARENTHRIGDYYTRDRSTPRNDAFWGGKESLTAAMGFEKNGVTTIMFRRKLVTNELTDHEIVDGDMQVIWARGQQPGNYIHQPPSGVEKSKVSVKDFYKTDELKYHGHKSQRGVTTFNFFDEKTRSKDELGGPTPLESGNCGGEWKYPRSCTVKNFTCEYYIRWSYKTRKDHITFTIKTKNTDTWTGIGFSEDDKMTQTDAILGWVDKTNGRPFVMDTWISGYSLPLLDPSQDIYNISGKIENGVTTLMFSRKRATKDTKDFSFTDDHCLYMMFPVKGGIFNSVNKKIRKHTRVPFVSSDRICIKSCGIDEPDDYDMMTAAPSGIDYEVEVKLVNVGDGFKASQFGTQEFEITSNRISDDFEPTFKDKIPGFYRTQLTELKKNDDNGIIAKINVIVEKNEKGQAVNPEDTLMMIEGVLKEALLTGRIGSLRVDPNYLVVKPPIGYELSEDKERTIGSNDLLLGTTKLYVVIGCIAAMVALALLQASCTLYKATRKRMTKQERLITNNMWKDYSTGAKTNFGFEAFETEEKVPPPPVSNPPRTRDVTDGAITMPGKNMMEKHRLSSSNGHNNNNHNHKYTNNHHHSHQMSSTPRATYSLPRAPGTRQPSPPPQLSYYTQDRRNNRSKSHGNGNSQSSGQQPDFYFMPSQRKYSGEVVRVYVDYGNQKPK
ncbi:hypothetical protein G9C98_002148 [Cotesia typhae]|uniref:Cell surface glycoprotein 1 n=1 Tax=Cotesia typhae TaxID=2053667 RepID=A0A8J5UWY9_9HYME|nr:hypothetical protein G9C98_002148 [Cotesia typhae]